MPDFQNEDYTGKWYQVLSTTGPYPQSRLQSQQDGWTCLRADWQWKEYWYQVENTAYYEGEYHTNMSSAYFDSGSGKFEWCPGDDCYEETVIDTDYETYAVLFTCESTLFGFVHIEYAWVNARQPNFDGSSVSAIILNSTSLDQDDLVNENEEQCPTD